nr:hypothetical protein [uncultured Clostridium sp.]
MRKIANTLMETIEIEKAYYQGQVKRRTESEILTTEIEKAKEIEKKESGGRKSRYAEEALAPAVYLSKTHYHCKKKGERPIKEEERQRIEEYLSLPAGGLDPKVDQYKRGFHKSVMIDIFNRETYGEGYSEEDEKIYDEWHEEREYKENNYLANKQMIKIKKWFYDSKLNIESCYRLAEYVESYLNIDDDCYTFYLSYSVLDKKWKHCIREMIEEVTIPVKEFLRSEEKFSDLEFMMKLTDDDINKQVKQDKFEIENSNKTCKDIEQLIRDKYWKKMQEKCDYDRVCYSNIENLYKRFWAYVYTVKEDWEVIVGFTLLKKIEKHNENGVNLYQNMFFELTKSLQSKGIKGDQNKRKNKSKPIENELMDALTYNENGCIIPVLLTQVYEQSKLKAER